MGVEIELGPDVLVPREETELLGKNAVSILGRIEGAPIVVDMCCGSGNLAVAIACHCLEARIWAADLTDSTVALARSNILRHSLAGRVTVRQGDLFAAIEPDSLKGTVDMVVCNPPYISSSRLENESAHLLNSEPREAFDGGPYGISILQRMIREAADYLKPDGWLLFEFGEGQDRQVAALLARSKAYDEPTFALADGKPRVAIVKKRAVSGLSETMA
jgi:HemK-like putative methylase